MRQVLALILGVAILFGIIGCFVGMGVSAFLIDSANLGQDKLSLEASQQLANYYTKNGAIIGACVGLFMSGLFFFLQLLRKISNSR